MHEGRGLERSICRLSPEMRPRNAAQLIVDERDEPLERRRVATPPIEKEARDLRTALFCHFELQRRDPATPLHFR